MTRESGAYAQPNPPSGAKQVTITVDGKAVSVPEGSLVIQACERAQSPVPFYCYHPGLSIAGNCRICLVEIEGQQKPQIACNTRVAEGMRVQTTSDMVLAGRQAVLEFLLANHPLDCPVCDQAGECWLQDYYMEHGLYDPAFDEQKTKKPKAVPLGPTVMLDAERCILCSRCVRFTDEITKTGEFGIFHRGHYAEIGMQPGKTLDNPYAGNVVDICPVGALTDRDFRFKCRVWYLGSADSVCPGCSRGCNIQIHYNRERAHRPHIAGGARIMRLKPRYNPDVNRWWMCDEGRYGYKAIDEGRLTQPQVRAGDTLRPASWEEALERVAALKALPAEQIGVVLSSQQTNEELYAAKRLFTGLGVGHIVFQRPAPGASDTLLIQADKSPNAAGAQALGVAEGAEPLLRRAAEKALKALVVFTQDLTALFGEELVRRAAEGVEWFVFIGSHANPTSALAGVALPAAVYAEQDGTFTNVDGRVQRLHQAVAPLGEAQPGWAVAAALGIRLGVPLAFPDAMTVFLELARSEAAFRGLMQQTLGEHGSLLKQ